MLAADIDLYLYKTEEVLYNHDGDTNRARLDYGDSIYSKRYLRLVGVWAPELHEPGGPEALEEINRLLAGVEVLYVRTKKDQYSFNRLLCWQWFEPAPGAELYSVNDHMVRWLEAQKIARDPAREARLVLPRAA